MDLMIHWHTLLFQLKPFTYDNNSIELAIKAIHGDVLNLTDFTQHSDHGIASTNALRFGMDATPISDGRPVMWKRFFSEEGPYKLQINRLFSTEPLTRIREIIVYSYLMSSSCQTNLPSWCIPFCVRFINLHSERSAQFGEFVAFISPVCEVRSFSF